MCNITKELAVGMAFGTFLPLLLMNTGLMATETLVEAVKLASDSPPDTLCTLGFPRIFLDTDVKQRVFRKRQGKYKTHILANERTHPLTIEKRHVHGALCKRTLFKESKGVSL